MQVLKLRSNKSEHGIWCTHVCWSGNIAYVLCLQRPGHYSARFKCGEACYNGELKFISDSVKEGTTYVYFFKTCFPLPGSYCRTSAAWGHNIGGAS